MSEFKWSKYKLDRLGLRYFDLLFFFKRNSINKDYNQALIDLEKKISAIENTLLTSIKPNNWDDMCRLYNVIGYILLVSLDLKHINKLLLNHKGFGGDVFIMKTACVLIYESLEDIEQILGQKFNILLDTFKISKSVRKNYYLRKKDLSNLKKVYQNDLKKVRTYIGAHRDHDFLLQLEVFKGLEKSSILKILNEFEAKLYSLAEPLQIILNESVINFTTLKSSAHR